MTEQFLYLISGASFNEKEYMLKKTLLLLKKKKKVCFYLTMLRTVVSNLGNRSFPQIEGSLQGVGKELPSSLKS